LPPAVSYCSGSWQHSCKHGGSVVVGIRARTRAGLAGRAGSGACGPAHTDHCRPPACSGASPRRRRELAWACQRALRAAPRPASGPPTGPAPARRRPRPAPAPHRRPWRARGRPARRTAAQRAPRPGPAAARRRRSWGASLAPGAAARPPAGSGPAGCAGAAGVGRGRRSPGCRRRRRLRRRRRAPGARARPPRRPRCWRPPARCGQKRHCPACACRRRACQAQTAGRQCPARAYQGCPRRRRWRQAARACGWQRFRPCRGPAPAPHPPAQSGHVCCARLAHRSASVLAFAAWAERTHLCFPSRCRCLCVIITPTA